MLIEANAKINLALNIVERRVDLYHNLDMVVLPLKLHDTIDISVLPFKGEDSYITCDDPSITKGDFNLASVALRKMREYFNFTQQFRIHIHKAIPASAGLGGGSSDAAAVMKAVVKLLNLKTTEEELFKIALQIGADVPYFLKNKPARVNGIGEFITPIKIKKKYDVLLVKPKQGCATKEVFKASDDTSWGRADIEKTIEYIENDKLNELKNVINNDLEEAATNIVPEIKLLKNRLYNDGFEIVGMTGSGSTVFAFVKNPKLAKRKLAKYQEDYGFAEITSLYTNL